MFLIKKSRKKRVAFMAENNSSELIWTGFSICPSLDCIFLLDRLVLNRIINQE